MRVRLIKDVRYFKKEKDRLVWKKGQIIERNKIIDLQTVSNLTENWSCGVLPFNEGSKNKTFFFLRDEIRDSYKILGWH